jgi:hypothetical protein
MTDLQRLVKKLVEVLLARDPTGVHRPLTIADLRTEVLPYRTHRTSLGITSVEDYQLLILRLISEEGDFVRTNPPTAAERAKKEVGLANPNLDLVDDLGAVTIQIGAPSLARITELDLEPPRIEATRGLPLILMPEPREPESELDRDSDLEPDPVAAPTAGPHAGPRLVPDHEQQWAPPPSIELMPTMPSAIAPASVPPPIRSTAEPTEVPQFDALEPVDPNAVASRARACPACDAVLPIGREAIFCPFCGHRVGVPQCTQCGTNLEPAWRHCITCGKPTGPKPVA